MGIKKLTGNETLEELREWALQTEEEYNLVSKTNEELTTRNKTLEESNQKLFLRAMATKKDETTEEEETETFESTLLSEEMLKNLSDEEIEQLKELEDSLNGNN